MRRQLLRPLLIAALVLAVAAGIWVLPRTLSFGAATPPPAIELRSDPAPTAAPRATTQPRSVDGDDDDDDDDDGDDAREPDRAEPRTNRESAPDAGGTDDDDGDDGDDDDGDDDIDDDDD